MTAKIREADRGRPPPWQQLDARGLQILVLAGQFLHLRLERLDLLLRRVGFLLRGLLLRAQRLDLRPEVGDLGGERMRNLQHLVNLQLVVNMHPIGVRDFFGRDPEHLGNRADRVAGAHRVRDYVRRMLQASALIRRRAGQSSLAGRTTRAGGDDGGIVVSLMSVLRERKSAAGNDKRHREARLENCRPVLSRAHMNPHIANRFQYLSDSA